MSQPFAPVSSNNRNPSYHKIINSSVNFDEEQVLITNIKEREIYDNLSEIYSILKTLETIEKSYIKDLINDSEYTNVTTRLINQYNSLLKLDSLADFNIVDFTQEYWINVPNAIRRIQVGLPATVENNTVPQLLEPNSTGATGISTTNGNGNGGSFNSRAVAEATGSFITLMDAIKLNYKAKDQLHPLLSDLVQNINKVGSLDSFTSKPKLIEWLIKINKLNVYQELDELELRQFNFDLESSYKEFYSLLE
ncbi:hypothetical protein WICMUC_001678 [Wickerhamomyces mucosus]|uniref:Vacuolar protein sorting-associated protein 28 n=1 Tax=Wickerhamomyces mucosus TaxID=1378264 RepID=A0A9P8PVF4_9ASCO|nr:hypothetical protein WICMUC_001678 [Wickerhamomyces mucosus]